MNRRDALRAIAIGAAAPAILRGRYQLFAQSTAQYSARTVRLVESSVVIDLLNQFQFPDYAVRPPKIDQWLTKPGTFTAEDFARYRASGITAFCLGHAAASYEEGLQFYARWNGFIAGYSDWLTRIGGASDFARAKAQNKVGVALTFQDSTHFRTPADVDAFFGLGQRVSQLTYNFRTLIGNGCYERRDEGLSDFGLTVVERMNKVGMAVDVSHCGNRTTLDAFDVSKKPVLITHANCRALNPKHPRCKTDEAIKAMAAKGGVMGITEVRDFVSAKEPTTVESMLDHYDYVARLVGIEHLGIGSDIDLFGYDALPPEEIEEFRSTPKVGETVREKSDVDGLNYAKRPFDIAEGLLRRNYSDVNIEAILGGNFRRVLKEIWTV
jgi:membrane dipeptidase